QQVAQFLAKIGKILALDRVGDLIGFLDRIMPDRAKVLLQVPGATAIRVSKRRHDVDEARNVAGWLHGGNPENRLKDSLAKLGGDAEGGFAGRQCAYSIFA